jgi:hypothetical protein
MMSEPKPLASLTSGLLARKGGARPAMRRQVALNGLDPAGHDDLGWNDMGYDVDPTYGAPEHHASGLTPMMSHHDAAPVAAAVHALPGVDQQAAVEEAVEPVVVEQRRKVQALAHVHAAEAEAEAYAAAVAAAPVAPAPKRAPRARSEAGANGRFAFTLRLDGQRHLLLRLASAATNRSAQQILTKLVDDYFASQPAVAAMAAQVGNGHAEGEDA